MRLPCTYLRRGTSSASHSQSERSGRCGTVPYYRPGDGACLVKKFRGSLSGEHGDGRLRGEFIPLMVGEEIYQWFREIKQTWDPDSIFNAGKITDTPAMNRYLRYEPGKPKRQIETVFDFSITGGHYPGSQKDAMGQATAVSRH